MPDDVILLIFGDIIVAHAPEVIVGGVVFTHMGQAKTEVLALPQPPFGRAVLTRQVTTGMVAAALSGAGLRLLLHADAFENWRIQIHLADNMGATRLRQGGAAC